MASPLRDFIDLVNMHDVELEKGDSDNWGQYFDDLSYTYSLLDDEHKELVNAMYKMHSASFMETFDDIIR